MNNMQRKIFGSMPKSLFRILVIILSSIVNMNASKQPGFLRRGTEDEYTVNITDNSTNQQVIGGKPGITFSMKRYSHFILHWGTPTPGTRARALVHFVRFLQENNVTDGSKQNLDSRSDTHPFQIALQAFNGAEFAINFDHLGRVTTI